jgi:hypothetical protein
MTTAFTVAFQIPAEQDAARSTGEERFIYQAMATSGNMQTGES